MPEKEQNDLITRLLGSQQDSGLVDILQDNGETGPQRLADSPLPDKLKNRLPADRSKLDELADYFQYKQKAGSIELPDGAITSQVRLFIQGQITNGTITSYEQGKELMREIFQRLIDDFRAQVIAVGIDPTKEVTDKQIANGLATVIDSAPDLCKKNIELIHSLLEIRAALKTPVEKEFKGFSAGLPAQAQKFRSELYERLFSAAKQHGHSEELVKPYKDLNTVILGCLDVIGSHQGKTKDPHILAKLELITAAVKTVCNNPAGNLTAHKEGLVQTLKDAYIAIYLSEYQRVGDSRARKNDVLRSLDKALQNQGIKDHLLVRPEAKPKFGLAASMRNLFRSPDPAVNDKKIERSLSERPARNRR